MRHRKAHSHGRKLKRDQVLEMRERAQPGGDLHGRSLIVVGRAYRVGSGEAQKALAGLPPYENLPLTNIITNYNYLRSSIPGTIDAHLLRASATPNMGNGVDKVVQPSNNGHGVRKQEGIKMEAGHTTTFSSTPDWYDDRGASPQGEDDPITDTTTGSEGSVELEDSYEAPAPTDDPSDEFIRSLLAPKKFGGRKPGKPILVADVRTIRRLFLEGNSIPSITNMLGHPAQTVYRIIRGQQRFEGLPDLYERVGRTPRANGRTTGNYKRPSTPAITDRGTLDAMREEIGQAIRLGSRTPTPTPTPTHVVQPAVAPDMLGIIKQMLAVVPPEQLGWVRRPDGRELSSILADVRDAQGMLTLALDDLTKWATEFEAAQRAT